mgnify:FL=1
MSSSVPKTAPESSKHAAALAFDKDPSGGDRPFMHLFFEMADGNFIAFFDAPNNAADDQFNIKDGIEDYHFAFEVEDMNEMNQFMDRLAEAKVPVAVSTDFNPGTAPSFHLPLAMMLHCGRKSANTWRLPGNPP